MSAPIRTVRLRPFRWEGSAPGLLNPRYGLTAAAARRRVQADLDREWRTGKVARHQRRIA